MKTQISRNTFAPEKRFSGIYQQMGRMLPDADWNELSELVKERLNEAMKDVVGSGTPRGRGLVKRLPGPPADLCELRWGHAYVDGIPAQVRPAGPTFDPDGIVFEYANQADFPSPPPLPSGDYKLYLDVWERAVTSLEDGALRDPGLHGADTCTRTQTMAQIKWCPLGADPEDPDRNPPVGNAPLTLTLRAGTAGDDPCDPCAEAMELQDRTGNYLFRVEVHDVTYDAAGAPDGLTLKWSAENGAEQYAITATPPGFASADFAYEFHSGKAENFATEKHLGFHLETDAAWAPARGSLVSGYPEFPPAGFSLVRRWDGFCRLIRTGATWSLAAVADPGSDRGAALSAASAADAHGHFQGGAQVRLSLDLLLLDLDPQDHVLLAGDYWTAAVREAVHESGDVVLDAGAPQGIVHHYLTVAQVVGGQTFAWAGPGCKALEFPPLTDIKAADVCYDGSGCDRSGATTVQEAIDFLCKERDLAWHNKHLHGWGIVCGLEVECGPDTLAPAGGGAAQRHRVRIRPGYALDCEGHDIVLEETLTLNMMAKIAEYETEHGEALIQNGQGTVCLVLERNAAGEAAIRLTPYDPADSDWASLLDGTLLKDVFDDCVGDLLEALKDELQPAGEGESGENGEPLVSAQRKKLTTLLNLVWQLWDSQNGRAIFLSKREHDILRAFYLRLQELLQSKTFCGMFKGDEFPEYPFPDTRMDTFFGKGGHDKLLLDSGNGKAYTYGGGVDTIHVYDLKSGELAAAVKMPAGEGAEVTALALSPSGKRLYAAAQVRQVDTVFATADISGFKFSWSRVAVICDLLFDTFILDPGDEELIFATALGKGVYYLRPDALLNEAKPNPVPVFAFPATGHLVLDEERRRLYAGATSVAGEFDLYNRVVMLNLALPTETANNLPPTGTIALLTAAGAPRQGRDGLALGGKGVTRLFVAVDAGGGFSKQVWTYDVSNFVSGNFNAAPAVLQTDETTLRLRFHSKADRLLLSLEDSHRLQAISPSGTNVAVARIPAQINPIALAVDPESGDVYALNYASNTLSRIPQAEIPVTDVFLNELSDYRDDVLLAYYTLFGSLLQYLKDCFCHHLLVKNPTCGEDDIIYLGCVDIRESQVYKICNFSKRHYVKSFPTVGYWLSLVPIIPMLKKTVEKFCCSIIPSFFSKHQDKVLGGPKAAYSGNLNADNAAAVSASKPLVSGAQTRAAVATFNRTDFKAETRTLAKRANVYKTLGTDAAVEAAQSRAPARGKVGKAQLVGNSVPEAQAELTRKGVKIQDVVEYDGKNASSLIADFAKTPPRLSDGDSVVLYKKDDKVLFYAIKEASAGAPLSVSAKAELQDFERRKSELENTISLREELNKMHAEVKSVRAEREAEAEALGRLGAQREALKLELGKMQADFQGLSVMHRELALEISKGRPVTDIAGITPEINEHLRDLGVRSVEDLSKAKPGALTKTGTLSANRASTLIKSAQERLNPQ